MKTIKIDKDEYIIVKGEASVKVAEGEINVFGSILKDGDGFYIPLYRQIPIIGLAKTKLEFDIKGEFHLKNINYNPIPREWENIVEDAKHATKIMIIGDVDVGKSGLTLFLANSLLNHGYKVGIIDCDIGQSDIGPPTTIGLSIPDKTYATYWDLPLKDAYFVGDKTPVGHLLPMVIGTMTLVNKALGFGVDKIVINTTGFIYGNIAYTLKRYKVEAVNPDLIILINKRGEVLPFKSIFHDDNRKIIVIEVPKTISEKSVVERREFRQVSLARFFEESSKINLNLDEVKIINTLLTKNFRNQDYIKLISSIVGITPLAVLGDVRDLVVLFEDILEQDIFSRLLRFLKRYATNIRIDSINRYNGLLLGLFDDKGFFKGLGRLELLDIKSNVIKILTPVNKEDINEIHFGYILLDEKYNEIGRIRPGSGLI